MATLDYGDRQDFDDVDRGHMATLTDPVARSETAIFTP